DHPSNRPNLKQALRIQRLLIASRNFRCRLLPRRTPLTMRITTGRRPIDAAFDGSGKAWQSPRRTRAKPRDPDGPRTCFTHTTPTDGPYPSLYKAKKTMEPTALRVEYDKRLPTYIRASKNIREAIEL